MKNIILILIIVALSSRSVAQEPLPLIPYPVEVKQQPGKYLLKNRILFSSDFPAAKQESLFRYLRDELKKWYNVTVVKAAKGQKADIAIQARKMPTGSRPAYQLLVNKNGIVINGNFDESAFHGTQTLFQLIPLKGPKEIPLVEIFDYPRFDYRGMHLDVGRHFFPVSYIRKYIDYLAYHKFNKFHWHLTEDQGWRIEIKKYPELTTTGGWRNGTIIGRYPGKGSDNKGYGGYYTQAEVKDVVRYAAQRHIEVIPEIEMPGHSSAAIASYPWLSCFPDKATRIPPNMISRQSIDEQKEGRIKLVQETWGVFDDVFCAGNDSTFLFLQNVIDEVITLFPSKYFHIGGDECPKRHWKQCPRCQQRIKDNHLKDEHELQSYFVQRVEKYLNSKGKTLIGWDEILEGGLAPNAIVMSWRGEKGGIEAAKQKHQVIMTPGNPVYFDHTQSLNEDSVTIGGYNPLDKVYAYEPIPAELSGEEGKYVLGAQANVWTEYMENTRKIEYMVFPRMSALSEVLWSPKENRDWESFEKRLPVQFERYEKWKANYSKAYYDLAGKVVPRQDTGISWNLETKIKNANIYYRNLTGGDTNYADYISPVIIEKAGTYEAIVKKDGKILSNPLLQQFFISKSTGKKISLYSEPSKKYPGNGAFTLVNGIQNEKGLARSMEFLGFEGTDCEAVIDLGETTSINEIVIHHFEQPSSWIYSPSTVDVGGSSEGTNFSPFPFKATITKSAGKDRTTIRFEKPAETRYLKLRIFNYGQIPEGNPGAGNKAWLFLDEIELK